jgi:zinc/manganese transport system permease protein
MSIWFLLAQPFAQHALVAAALVAVTCGLIAPLVVIRGMSFAVHGTAELAFTGAAAGLLIANNPVAGALAGSLVVAVLIATLGASPRERDSAIGAILAFGMGIGVLLLGFYHGFATAATNILFGNIFGVSGGQLLILVIINLLVVVVMATWYRPLLFASVDPEAAEARGVPVARLGLLFLIVLALTVTGAAQVVGTLLVLSLAITPAAAAQRLSASPLVVAALSVVFAVIAADGGLLASFGATNIKASVFITSISFAIYLAARLAGPRLRDRRQRHHARPPAGPQVRPRTVSGQRLSASCSSLVIRSIAASTLCLVTLAAPASALSIAFSIIGSPLTTRSPARSAVSSSAASWSSLRGRVPPPNHSGMTRTRGRSSRLTTWGLPFSLSITAASSVPTAPCSYSFSMLARASSASMTLLNAAVNTSSRSLSAMAISIDGVIRSPAVFPTTVPRCDLDIQGPRSWIAASKSERRPACYSLQAGLGAAHGRHSPVRCAPCPPRWLPSRS